MYLFIVGGFSRADFHTLIIMGVFRCFSYADSQGGVGSAVPDRVNLFRVQTLRAVGGNAWRMVSHTAMLYLLILCAVYVWGSLKRTEKPPLIWWCFAWRVRMML